MKGGGEGKERLFLEALRELGADVGAVLRDVKFEDWCVDVIALGEILTFFASHNLHPTPEQASHLLARVLSYVPSEHLIKNPAFPTQYLNTLALLIDTYHASAPPNNYHTFFAPVSQAFSIEDGLSWHTLFKAKEFQRLLELKVKAGVRFRRGEVEALKADWEGMLGDIERVLEEAGYVWEERDEGGGPPAEEVESGEKDEVCLEEDDVE
ncbi:hypothetical protein HDV00_010719 [Rhizophlyctis rosea]|nr:hypothetical protein HDV00_010719 [Rhizophlyctis rosea]